MSRWREWSDGIARGRGGEVRRALLAVRIPSLERGDRVPFANLCWRAGLPELGVRALHAVVRPPPSQAPSAELAERAEYAQCLIKNGSVEEGMALLVGTDPAEVPQTLFFRMSALVAQWNYRDAIPVLRQYLAIPSLGAYARLVAEVNLAAAMVHERQLREATPLLRQLLYTASLRGYRLMLGRVMEIAAENFIEAGRWREAREFLAEAQSRLAASEGIDAFFVRKYQAVVAFLEARGARGSDEMTAVRAEALARGHWETARDCDRVLALPTKDPASWLPLYFGTPFRHYRERLLIDMGAEPTACPPYFDRAWQAAGYRDPALDLFTGAVRGAGEGLKPGALLHRLVLALSCDFYRPISLATLFHRLYPARFYHPRNSPPLVHDGLARLRGWLRDAALPLRIAEHSGHYELQATAPVSIRIPAPEALELPHAALLEGLRRASRVDPFSISDAIGWLGLPRRTVLRILQQACSGEVLERMGKGRFTRYHFRK
jgi:hypothetical protein